MIDLTSLSDVKQLQTSMRASIGNEHGKDFMIFMEQLCGWYDMSQTDTNQILISHGKRQVLATIKTLLERTPEQIVAITQGVI